METSYQIASALTPYIILFLLGLLPGMWQPVAFILFYVTLGQAFNIFLGLTGYVDFGYVAFLALGAYGMAITVAGLAQYPWMGWGVILAGAALSLVMASILSVIVGAVALRLRGAYFAIATIGVNEGLKYLVPGAHLWGGSEGILISTPLYNIFGAKTANFISTFFADIMTLLVGIAAALTTIQILRSRMGYALLAIREDEDAARAIGINTTKYKILAFILSASFAGLLGASAWTLKLTYVFPEDVFVIHYTVEAIVIVMLGGAGTILGPIIGGVIYGALRYYLATIVPGLQLLVLAPILVIIVTMFRAGIVGSLREALRHLPISRYLV